MEAIAVESLRTIQCLTSICARDYPPPPTPPRKGEGSYRRRARILSCKGWCGCVSHNIAPPSRGEQSLLLADSVRSPPPLRGGVGGGGPHPPKPTAYLRPYADAPPHSRGTMHPSYRRKFIRPSSEGAGKAGCPLHPRSVCKKWKHTEVTTGVGGSVRPSLRNGFNGFLRALPSDRAFLPLSSCRYFCAT